MQLNRLPTAQMNSCGAFQSCDERLAEQRSPGRNLHLVH